uniref:Uncharacterized protein n=1 Tax=Arundo donax TaxID=35708 RepID=A0A0A9DVW4_ARUDO
MLIYMFSSSVFTRYTNSFLKAGVRALRTGFFGYHSFISPVRRSNVLSVDGQTMQPSWVSLALRRPSVYAPSAGERFSMAYTWSLYHSSRISSPSCTITRRSPRGSAASGTTGTHDAPPPPPAPSCGGAGAEDGSAPDTSVARQASLDGLWQCRPRRETTSG